jgi:hypothetical protein
MALRLHLAGGLVAGVDGVVGAVVARRCRVGEACIFNE